jgi:hypothetical protein
MNDTDWFHDIQWQDLKQPTEDIRGEAMYTVFMADFLRMPYVDFRELATLDPAIRALLN